MTETSATFPAFLVRRGEFGEYAATFCGVAVELSAHGSAIGPVMFGGGLSRARLSFCEKGGAVAVSWWVPVSGAARFWPKADMRLDTPRRWQFYWIDGEPAITAPGVLVAISWDLEYGPVIPAHHSYGWEKLPPESLTRLDVSTAAFLKQMMDQISAGWEIGEVLTNDTLIIWVIDMAGQIWFAMEELVLNGEPRGIPKHQKMELTAAADKLGHPALVGCAAARIAGEIFFDPTRPPPLWVMNNKSRRYGVLPSPFRKDSHLKNAAKQFALFGIDLDTEFLPGLPI